MGAGQAVALLSRVTGARHELVGRLAGGETGAHEVVGPGGRRLVLKWELDPSTAIARRAGADLAERLRTEAGWPVPVQHVVDAGACLFVLQDLLMGEAVTRLTHAVVDDLLALHARRLGLARAGDTARGVEELLATLTLGGRGYCLHEPLRSHGPRTAALVGRVEAFGRSLRPEDLPADDLVHWDLHPGNLLSTAGRLTGVVDNDFVTTGDAAFDLLTLALTSLAVPCEDGVRRRLFDEACDGVDDVRVQAYLSHLFVRILDWPIRGGRPEEVDFWLAHADRLLDI